MKRVEIALVAAVAAMLLGLGCVASDDRCEISVDHPAHPQAQEVPFAQPPNTLAEPVSPTVTHAPPQSEARTYTCPMHPEVRQPAPGECPKCGMMLEPVSATEVGDQHQMHDMECGQ